MAFIIDKIRENLKSNDSDEDGDKGFDDLNYVIGNSSAMDMGEVPTPMDERIGYASMIGGELLELQITNPATFEMEAEQMIRTIDQLGLDITLHPDMNAGFTSAYKAVPGENYGYDAVEQYITNYMQELAYFKKRVNEQGQGNEPLFNIGRMNPHISTTPMPALAERMAQEVSLDPFGFQVDEYNEEMRKMRKAKKQDIWANKNFLEKFYDVYLKNMVDQKWQLFTGRQGLFTQYSDKFDRVYRDTMRRACDHFYRETKKSPDIDELQAAISLISTAARADVGVQNAWLNKIDKEKDDPIQTLKFESEEVPEHVKNQLPDDLSISEVVNGVLTQYNVLKLSDLNDYLPPNVRVTRINSLAEAVYNIDNHEFSQPRGIGQAISSQIPIPMGETLIQGIVSGVKLKNQDKLEEWAKNEIKEGLNDIWHGETEEEEDEFLITVQGKLRALANNADIEVDRIRNRALREPGEGPEGEVYKDIDKAARKTLANEDGFFEEEDRYYQFMDALIGQFGREMWKESSLFYYIIPAWMSEADNNFKGHEGWKAPEFIWKVLVEDKWGGRDDVVLDLENPRNGVYDEDVDSDAFHYLDLLEESEEFRSDVAAAVGACYVWAHFTQRNAQFDLKGRDFGLGDDEVEEVKHEGWTWIEWMNRFGLGVNLETMAGSPRDRFKIWRPKDISVTAHAINLTARNQLEEDGSLGGLDHLHEELDGCPAKFTIDMEHVATMGAPPLDEMKKMVEQEGELAKNWPELEIDEDKPLAKIMRQMHLMDPGVEANRGTHHGAFDRGNEQLYEWLYYFVENGFARNENEPASVLFELGEHKGESSYMMRITMDLIELGVEPEDLDPSRVDPSTDPKSEEEALISRFYGIDRANYTREWAKIEEHAFDPLKGLLEAEPFDYTYSSRAATDNENRPQEWNSEEYR